MAHLRCSHIVGTRLITDSFCSPGDFKLTFDYYAVFRAAAKIDLRSVLISQGERNRKCLIRMEWRKELHHSYAAELRVCPPFSQRCDHFVEDYDPGHERRAWKMSRQTRMIRADYTDSFKSHPRIVSCIGSGDRSRCLLLLRTAWLS